MWNSTFRMCLSTKRICFSQKQKSCFRGGSCWASVSPDCNMRGRSNVLPKGSWYGRPPQSYPPWGAHRDMGSPCPGHSRKPAERGRVSEPQRPLVTGYLGLIDKSQRPQPALLMAMGAQGKNEFNARTVGKPVPGLALSPCGRQASYSTYLNLPFFLCEMGIGHCSGQYRLSA